METSAPPAPASWNPTLSELTASALIPQLQSPHVACAPEESRWRLWVAQSPRWNPTRGLLLYFGKASPGTRFSAAGGVWSPPAGSSPPPTASQTGRVWDHWTGHSRCWGAAGWLHWLLWICVSVPTLRKAASQSRWVKMLWMRPTWQWSKRSGWRTSSSTRGSTTARGTSTTTSVRTRLTVWSHVNVHRAVNADDCLTALLQLKAKHGQCAEESSSVRTVCLPPAQQSLRPGHSCEITGYGKETFGEEAVCLWGTARIMWVSSSQRSHGVKVRSVKFIHKNLEKTSPVVPVHNTSRPKTTNMNVHHVSRLYFSLTVMSAPKQRPSTLPLNSCSENNTSVHLLTHLHDFSFQLLNSTEET